VSTRLVYASASALVALLAALPSAPILLRAPCALLLVAWLPGRSLSRVFAGDLTRDAADRAFFALGLSLACTVVAGLLLDALSIGLTRASWCAALGLTAILPCLVPGRTQRPERPRWLRSPTRIELAAALGSLAIAIAAIIVTTATYNDGSKPPPTALWIVPRLQHANLAEVGIYSSQALPTTFSLAVSARATALRYWTIHLTPHQTWTANIPIAPRGMIARLYLTRDGRLYRTATLPPAASGNGG